MDGQGGGGFGGDNGGGFGGHHHHGGSGQEAGAFMWIRQTYGRDVVRPEDIGTRSRANSRWWLLLVAALAAVALVIPLVL